MKVWLTVLLIFFSLASYSQYVDIVTVKGDTVSSELRMIDRSGIYTTSGSFKFKHVNHVRFHGTPKESQFKFLKSSGVNYSLINSPTDYTNESIMTINDPAVCHCCDDIYRFKKIRTYGKSMQILSMALSIVGAATENQDMVFVGASFGLVGFLVDFSAGIPFKSPKVNN